MMFAKSENLGLELKIKIFSGVKSFRKEIFLGSTWNHSAPKSLDSAEIAKNSFLGQTFT